MTAVLVTGGGTGVGAVFGAPRGLGVPDAYAVVTALVPQRRWTCSAGWGG